MPTARNRDYSAPPATAALGMSYGWSDLAVITGNQPATTGAWRPVSIDANGFVNVNAGLQFTGALNATIGAVAVTGGSITINNTSPIPVSGVVVSTPPAITPISGYVTTIVTGGSVSFDSTAIVSAQASGNVGIFSGNAYLASISGKVNTVVPVSGVVQANITNTAPLATSGVVQANVTNTAPIPVSGVVVTTVTVGNVAITGFNSTIAPLAVSGTFSATIGNLAITGFNSTIPPLAVSGNVQSSTLLAAIVSGNVIGLGISGQLAANISGAAWVTGDVLIDNPILAISGIVTTAATPIQAISGFVTNITIPIQAVSGIVTVAATPIQAVSGSTSDTITGFNTGIIVYTQPVTKASVSNLAPSGTSPWSSMTSFQSGQIFAANPSRVMFFVQNIHTGIPLYVSLSANGASTGNFNFILNPSINLGYGGSSFSDDHYRGAVCVSGGGWAAFEA